MARALKDDLFRSRLGLPSSLLHPCSFTWSRRSLRLDPLPLPPASISQNLQAPRFPVSCCFPGPHFLAVIPKFMVLCPGLCEPAAAFTRPIHQPRPVSGGEARCARGDRSARLSSCRRLRWTPGCIQPELSQTSETPPVPTRGGTSKQSLALGHGLGVNLAQAVMSL